jgi:hypothetical protein
MYVTAVYDQTGRAMTPAEVQRAIGGSMPTINRAFASLREHKVLPASEQATATAKGRENAGLPTATSPDANGGKNSRKPEAATPEAPATDGKPADAGQGVPATGEQAADADPSVSTPQDDADAATQLETDPAGVALVDRVMTSVALSGLDTGPLDAESVAGAGYVLVRVAAADISKALEVLRMNGITFEPVAMATTVTA